MQQASKNSFSSDPRTRQLFSVVDTFRNFSARWFICGGWALDIFLGRVTRDHQDVEIGIFRDDQEALHAYLKDWNKSFISTAKEEKSWDAYRKLGMPVHEIYARRDAKTVEILLNERTQDQWVYRRDAAIRHPLSKALLHDTQHDVPYLAPEIVLLYKSKKPREKDNADFETVRPSLEPAQVKWLSSAIATSGGNPWL